jgi:hypothetical protein
MRGEQTMKRLFLYLLFTALVIFEGCAQKKPVPPAMHLYPIWIDGKTGFINANGKIVVKPRYRIVNNFSEGLAVADLKRKMTILDDYGYIDFKGKIIIPARFAYANDFSEGLAAVAEPSEDLKIAVRNKTISSIDNIKFGYIDWTGKYVIPQRFYGARSFSEGLAAVTTTTGPNTKWGYIDKQAKIVIPERFAEANEFHDGRAVAAILVAANQKRWGVIDQTGAWIVKPQFTRAGNRYHEGFLPAEKDSKWGYLDLHGKLVIPFQFRSPYPKLPEIHGAFKFSEGLAAVFNGKRWGYIDKQGKWSIKPQFLLYNEQGSSFSEGLAAVCTYNMYHGAMPIIIGKWGFIDKTGNVVIQPIYKRFGAFEHGLAPVWSSNYQFVGYIDHTGKWIWKQQLGFPRM